MERFWSKVNRAGPDECWQWTAASGGDGYAYFYPVRSGVPAHRFAWILTYGEIAPGLVVCHKCDNRRCVNPAHLFLGTQQDNMNDMWAKGRSKEYGATHHAAKLTQKDVDYIREHYKPRHPTYGAHVLGKQFGVRHTAISRIANGKRWAAVD